MFLILGTETIKSGKMFKFLSKAPFLREEVPQNGLMPMFSVYKSTAEDEGFLRSKEFLGALEISYQRFELLLLK